MKIAYDHQIFTNQKYGGVSRYFLELAENISKISTNDIHVKIMAPVYKNNYLYSSVGKFRSVGLRVPDLPKTGRTLKSVNNIISNYLLKNYNPDIIHETYYSKSVVGPKKIKRVITVYDMIHELFSESFSVNDPTRMYKRVATSRADHIICISKNTKNDLIEILGVDESKVSVVHLGFELADTHPSSKRVSSRPFFLFVGSRRGYKNFKRLVMAYHASINLLKNLDFVCFGGGSFNSEELSFFKELKIPFDCIRQVAGDDALLSQYYKNAFFFVYPSLYEGFGIPPLEAMSYGCPVACSNTSSIPEVVGDAAIMFDPYSIESMQYSLEKLFLDSNIRDSLITRGFERIKKYSWKKCAGETIEIYRKIIA